MKDDGGRGCASRVKAEGSFAGEVRDGVCFCSSPESRRAVAAGEGGGWDSLAARPVCGNSRLSPGLDTAIDVSHATYSLLNLISTLGRRGGLFELSHGLYDESEFHSRLPRRAAQGHHASGGEPGRPSFGYFSWPRKKSDQPRGCPPENQQPPGLPPGELAIA